MTITRATLDGFIDALPCTSMLDVDPIVLTAINYWGPPFTGPKSGPLSYKGHELRVKYNHKISALGAGGEVLAEMPNVTDFAYERPGVAI